MRVYTRKLTGMICLFVFLTVNAHAAFADDYTETEMFFAREETYSGYIEVPGRGKMRYYAQNDPLWARLIYEHPDNNARRPFQDGGCGPTAAAMAVASLVPKEALSKISGYALRPYSLCPCSLNKGKCDGHHARYILTSARDFSRFLPLVFGDFAAGNNTFGDLSRGNTIGTNSSFLYSIAKVYGLQVTVTNDFDKALEAIKNHDAVVATAGRGGAFTNTGHYVFLAGADDEKLYFLDPLYREEYKTAQRKKLEILQPGLVAMKYADLRFAVLNGFFIFHVPDNAEGIHQD